MPKMEFCDYCGKLTKMEIAETHKPVCLDHINELIAKQRINKEDVKLLSGK